MSLTPVERRRIEAEWERLRGRPFNAAGLTHRFGGWFPDVDWKEMPSNQFLVSADEMRAAGWAMDYRRDDDGRLAE
jgi:hypothetical protein